MIQTLWLDRIESAQTLPELEEIRVALFGKNGVITVQLKGLGSLSPDQKREKGLEINALRASLQEALQSQRKKINHQAMEERLLQEKVDVSLPPLPEIKGSIHPITQVIHEVTSYFKQFGFQIALGPEIEEEEYNFTKLNIPSHHPARQNHDTFYLEDQVDPENRRLLRTHTSPVQIRTLLEKAKELATSQTSYSDFSCRLVVPGRVYRSDDDATHSPIFHQIEGLCLGKDIHMGHLKGCLMGFLRHFFDLADLPVRFRPSFFPFTEPSAEVDIGCKRKAGEVIIGTGADWLEILGCGMVHPRVLENCGLDSSQVQGFAFGMGIERLAMLKYGIPDIRSFYASDIRWLSHYGFPPLQ